MTADVRILLAAVDGAVVGLLPGEGEPAELVHLADARHLVTLIVDAGRLAAAVTAVLDLIAPEAEMASYPYGHGGGRWFTETDVRTAITACLTPTDTTPDGTSA